MKITNEHRKAINTAARATLVVGRFRCCEVAQRANDTQTVTNLLLLNERGELDGSDLFDLSPLAMLREVEDAPDGRAVLDIYVYAWTGFGRSLESTLSHNLTAVIAADGSITLHDGSKEIAA